MLAPFLEEIGVATRSGNHGVQRIGVYRHPFFLRRFHDGLPGVVGRQAADFRKLEKPLGVGLGLAEVASHLGQAGAEHDHRELALSRPVQRHDQGCKLVFLDVLELVDEQGQTGGVGLGCGPCGRQQVRKVGFQVPVVGQSGLWVEVHNHLNIVVFHLERLDEPRQPAQGPLRQLPGFFPVGKLHQGEPQSRGQSGGKGSVFGRLDVQGTNAPVLGILPDAVEQYGLADAAQTHHHDALAGTADPDTLQGDAGGLTEVVPPGQFRWRRAGSGSVWIADGIHVANL